MGARRSTLPSIMRLLQQRPVVVDAVQAVKVVEAAVARLVVEGAAGVLLVVPAAGTEAVRWPRVLKCRAWRSSTCCWEPNSGSG